MKLKALQRWFQERTVTGETADAEREILPSKSLAPSERLQVYSGMYPMRMRDAMQTDYPTIRAILGDDAFWDLVQAYVKKFPSKHPSLNRLGDHFPRFLAGKVHVPRRALLQDVATVELAMTEAFDERHCEPLDFSVLAKVPPEAWEKARFELVPASRLVTVSHAVNSLITAARREEPLPLVVPRKKTSMVVYRKDYAVWRMDLRPQAFALLSALAEGAPLGKAITASKLEDRTQVFEIFKELKGEKLFAAVHIGGRKPRA
jgi:hypothetical protein